MQLLYFLPFVHEPVSDILNLYFQNHQEEDLSLQVQLTVPLSHQNLSRVSVIGLNVSLPERTIAVTISGEATKPNVLGFPSVRFAKFLLNE